MTHPQRWRPPALLCAALALAAAGALHEARAGVVGHDFESLADGQSVTTQLPDLVFSHAVALAAGQGLNEFEFPPYDGATVLSDDAGAMTINFAAPVFGVGGFFTYAVHLDLLAYDLGGNLLISVGSLFGSNLALSGEAGSAPNEFMGLSDASSRIARIEIRGDPGGASFTLDGLRVETRGSVPEPSTWLLALIGLCSLPAGRWCRPAARPASAPHALSPQRSFT